MIWPTRLLDTRFDCFDKRDRLEFKTIIKDNMRRIFSVRQLLQLNRWRLYPLLAPFLDSENQAGKLYSLTLGGFLLKFLGIRAHSSEDDQKGALKSWMEQVLECQIIKQQQTLPVRLVQTTWNVEGAKQLCVNNLSTRHNEAERCMKKGPLLLQELRATHQDLQAWSKTFPNCRLIGTEARVRSESARASATDDLATEGTVGFPTVLRPDPHIYPTTPCQERERNEEGGESTGQGGVGIAWNTLNFGIETSYEVLVPHFVIQVTFQKIDGQVSYVSAYLRPGEQLSILQEWMNAWRRKPPRGYVFVAGDFNAKSKEVWTALIELMDEFGLTWIQSEGVDTYRRTSGYRSTLDHWFVRSNALEAGKCGIYCSRWYSARWKAEHARLRLHLNFLHSSGEGDAAKALPATAICRGAQNFALLARKIRSIPEGNSVQYLKKLKGIAWAWFNGNKRGYYEKKKEVLRLRKYLKQDIPRVLVPSSLLHVAFRHIDLGIRIGDLDTERQNGVSMTRISSELLHEVVMKLDFLEVHDRTGQPEEAVIRSTYAILRTPILHRRIRSLFPKFTGSLGALKRPDGTTATSLREVDQLVRSTRAFWVVDPGEIEQHLINGLYAYSEQAPAWSVMTIPPVQFFTQATLVSGDSAVGFDTLPFSVHRVDPDKTARMMLQRLDEIQNVDVPPPKQLLVWIPKATIGMHADDWRPLGMPTTFDRIFAAAIYKWTVSQNADILHPSQALLNDLREPQVNFKTISEKFQASWNKKSPLTSVLFTDLQKAFEYVHPAWIIAVLTARGAPRWLVKYTQYTFFHKQVVPKIQGRLLDPILVVTGVDMGNAISPFLFCLAIDPLLRKINSIHNVLLMKCYMDDNSTVLETFSPVAQIQKEFMAFQSAGVRVLKHECAYVSWYEEGRRFSTPKGPSWKRVITLALRKTRHLPAPIFYLAGDDKPSSKSKLAFLISPLGIDALARIISKPCSCKCKTALVCNQRLDARDVCMLDSTPWGAKIVTSCTTSLGLPFVGRFKKPFWLSPIGHTQKRCWRKKGKRGRKRRFALRPNPDNHRMSERRHRGQAFHKAELASLAHQKARKKIQTRERKYLHLINPVYSSLETHLSAVQSTTYYASSIFPPTAAIVHERNQSMCKAICKSGWIQADELPHVARFVKAVGGQTFQSAARLARIGLAIRTTGVKELWGGRCNKDSDLAFLQRTVREVMAALQQRDVKVTINHLSEKIAFASDGGRQLHEWFKWAFKMLDGIRGREFLRSRFCNFGIYSDQQIQQILETFNECPKSAAHPSVRIGALRWLLGADHDDIKKMHIEGRHLPAKCIYCANAGVLPLYNLEQAVCLKHSKELIILDHHPKRGCILCGQEGNHSRHWLVQCPVISRVIKEEYDVDKGFLGLIEQSCSSDVPTMARLLKASFCIRNALLSAGALDPVSTFVYNVTPKQWVRKLRGELNPAPPNGANRKCDCEYTHMKVFVPHAGVPMIAKRSGLRKGFSVATSYINSQEIFHCSSQDPCGPAMMHSLDLCQKVLKKGELGQLGARTNAIAQHAKCNCGHHKVTLVATRDIPPGTPIVLPFRHPVERGHSIIIQFDGSARAAGSQFACGGAGVVVWKVKNGEVDLVDWVVHPGKELINAALAEARGAWEAVKMAAKHCQEGIESITVQGDNAAVISFFQGVAKTGQLMMAEIFYEADRKAQNLPIKLKWEYIPREANPWADFLAGQASASIFNWLIQGDPMPDLSGVWDGFPCCDFLPDLQLDQDTNHRLLHEAPPVELQDMIELLHAIPDLSHHKRLQAIRNYHHRDYRKIFYSPRRKDGEGRVYPTSPYAAASCSKEVRLLLFGQGMVEFDLSGSFFAIAMEISPNFCQSIGFKSVAQVREWLNEVMAGSPILTNKPQFSKQLLARLLNTPVSVLFKWIGGVFFLPPVVREWIYKVYRARASILSQQLPGVSLQEDPRVQENNRVYFTLENWEASFMKAFIQKFLNMSQVRHLVWIHDAIWVPENCQDNARLAFEATKVEFAWKEIAAKETNLTAERLQLIERLRASPRQPFTSTIGQFLPTLPECPRPVPVSGAPHGKVERFRIIHSDSLHKYFNRKKIDHIAPRNLFPIAKKRKLSSDHMSQTDVRQFFKESRLSSMPDALAQGE